MKKYVLLMLLLLSNIVYADDVTCYFPQGILTYTNVDVKYNAGEIYSFKMGEHIFFVPVSWCIVRQ